MGRLDSNLDSSQSHCPDLVNSNESSPQRHTSSLNNRRSRDPTIPTWSIPTSCWTTRNTEGHSTRSQSHHPNLVNSNGVSLLLSDDRVRRSRNPTIPTWSIPTVALATPSFGAIRTPFAV